MRLGIFPSRIISRVIEACGPMIGGWVTDIAIDSASSRLKSYGFDADFLWVDLKTIQPQHGAARSADSDRQEHYISPDQIVLLSLGSMNKKQGLEMLAEVIHCLRDHLILMWLLAGEGPTIKELIQATAVHASHCVSPGDAGTFADALQELIESAEMRAQCGRLARKLAEEHFGQDAVQQRFEQQLSALHG